MPLVSVIIPFLNEAESLPALHERLIGVEEALRDVELEIVLVDDGSTDGSVEVIRGFAASPVSVRLVRLSRNFGSHAALAAGVAHSDGDAVAFISADLQDPPEILQQMITEWQAGGEIVWATREGREDPFLTRLFASAYYRLLRKWALPQMPPGGVDVVLADRRVVRSLGNLAERNSSVFNLLMWAGYEQRFIAYRRKSRLAGHSKWSFWKRIKLFIDSFVSFSFVPMRLISGLGMLLSAVGCLYALFITGRAVMVGTAVPGWSSLMVVVLLCSGLQLLMLGIISEYLWRALDAARNRPGFIVREVETVSSPDRQGSGFETPAGDAAARLRRGAVDATERNVK